MALHAEVGPARTTISEIARRAGVQRLTVYNTFPETADLYAACQSEFLARNPPPPMPATSARKDPLLAFEDLLRHQYAWYRTKRAMQEKVHRDRHLIPELDALMARTTDARLDAAAGDHVAAFHPPPARSRSLRAILRLALAYPSWELLADQGLSDIAIARLMREVVDGVRRASG